MNDYQGSAGFRGDPAKALEFARGLLAGLNFQVVMVSSNRLDAQNSQSFLSTKQNPLLGASRIVIDVSSGMIQGEAEFGKLQSMVKFLYVFLWVMTVMDAGILAAVFFATKQNPWLFLTCLGAVIPAVIIPPLVNVVQRKRLSAALEVLLKNVADAGV